MAPPNRLVRVEWMAARHPDRPHEMSEQARNFTTHANAARQVAAVQRWAPKFAALLGVWECEPQWVPVDPDQLPAPEEENPLDASPGYITMMEEAPNE